ncbi:MAG: LysR family transcriptional regulator substrate-binding protein [Mobilitalea sp.]
MKLEDYIKAYPNVELEYEICSFKKLQGMLKKHEVDIIISVFSELESDILNLNICQLMDLDPGIILSDKHPLSQRKHLLVSDLVSETFYIFSDSYSSDAQEKILTHCKDEGFVPKKIHYCDSIHSMELGISTGKGVAIGYYAFFRNERNRLGISKPLEFI